MKLISALKYILLYACICLSRLCHSFVNILIYTYVKILEHIQSENCCGHFQCHYYELFVVLTLNTLHLVIILFYNQLACYYHMPTWWDQAYFSKEQLMTSSVAEFGIIILTKQSAENKYKANTISM